MYSAKRAAVCVGAVLLLCWLAVRVVPVLAGVAPVKAAPVKAAPAGAIPASATPAKASKVADRAQLRKALAKLPYKIVFESYRGKSWDIYAMNANGSGEVDLTKNPRTDEMYPHASPDGTKICFVVDEGKGRSRTRSVYMMNADGKGIRLVARNGRQPCWSPDGRSIAYTKAEYRRFTTSSYGTKGLYAYDVASRRSRPHSNDALVHISYLCWAPGGDWIFATVHGGMGYTHADLAIRTRGNQIFEFERIRGCRVDVTADGKKILWNMDDQTIVAADLDLSSVPPKVGQPRVVVSCPRDHKMYHGDWSPSGRYIAFSYGPGGSQHVGEMARGWNICVADASKENVWVTLTSRGVSNKEPDWMIVGQAGGEVGDKAGGKR